MIPPERRLPEAVGLVDNQAYFALHAPRQTGFEERATPSGRRITLLRA